MLTRPWLMPPRSYYAGATPATRQRQFAIYRAGPDDRDESVFHTGPPIGTCQDALNTACGIYPKRPQRLGLTPPSLEARPADAATRRAKSH